MSFVSIVVSSEFVTVMSDGRVSGENNTVLEENYKKFKKISPKQFIAYVGSRAICEHIVEQIEYIDEQIYNLYDTAIKIKEVISGEQLRSINSYFAIGGLDLDGQFRIYVISNLPKEEIEIIQNVSKDGLTYKLLTSPFIVERINREEMEQIFITFLRKTGFNTPDKCLQAQKLLSHFIADIDTSVNKHSFSLTIKK